MPKSIEYTYGTMVWRLTRQIAAIYRLKQGVGNRHLKPMLPLVTKLITLLTEPPRPLWREINRDKRRNQGRPWPVTWSTFIRVQYFLRLSYDSLSFTSFLLLQLPITAPSFRNQDRWQEEWAEDLIMMPRMIWSYDIKADRSCPNSNLSNPSNLSNCQVPWIIVILVHSNYRNVMSSLE